MGSSDGVLWSRDRDEESPRSPLVKVEVLWPGRRPSPGGPRAVEAAEEPQGDEEGESRGVRPGEGPPS